MAYSTSNDLLFGSVPPPSDVDKWIQLADDEIDASIGNTYLTPITFPASSDARPSKLLVKNASAMLATGRAIMAIDSGSEEDGVHQYGLYLIKEARKVIDAIACGETVLTGVQLTGSDADITSAPKVYNTDASSAVEGFFSNFQTPSFTDFDRPYWMYQDRGH